MWFLQRRDSPEWWAAVTERSHSAPALIRELLRGPSVVCERSEAMQALAWAKAHPAWRGDLPALRAGEEQLPALEAGPPLRDERCQQPAERAAAACRRGCREKVRRC